ncbi:alpha/beta hydrolase [Streptomyces sp. NPDC051567]|uniref:alpha/beta hydrolase n=1 Tax=Streptomyces sp. NPDC051567 TaxID=3365660 RepID=UPI00378EFB6B
MTTTTPTPTPEAFVSTLARTLAFSIRTPIMRRPDEYGLAYEDVHFPSQDGTTLEGWFIPADSDRLVIANHPMPCNRYGYPGHLKEFSFFADFECNFLPDYKNLHDAGYNVLAYDLRNHGRSDAANGGIVGIGLLEYRDVLGSLHYARSRMNIDNTHIGFLSRCLGANSTIVAMSRHPEEFEGVRAMIALQPVSLRPFGEVAVEANNIPDGIAMFEQEIKKLTSFDLDELSPLAYAKDVRTPTFVVQVHHDSTTRPSDVQGIYDNIGASDKKLFWIEGTTRRFDGYNYFAQEPDQMLDWFNSHFS